MSDYDTDILKWSVDQAELLRRIAAGEHINDRVDWENVIEEVESVGRSELNAVASHLVQALVHDLKVKAWPASREVPHWQAEARGHRDDARAAYSDSMKDRPELDVERLYRRALHRMPASIDGQAPEPVPPTCQMTLDEVMAGPDGEGEAEHY